MSDLTTSQAVEVALELLGPDGGVAIGEVSASTNLRWANSQLTTNGSMQETSLSVAAFVPVDGGLGCGISSAQVRTREDIQNLIAAGRTSAIAGGASEDAEALIEGPTSDNFHDTPVGADSSGVAHIAGSLGEAMRDAGAEFFGYAEQSTDTMYVATSSGTRLRFSQSTSRFELCAKSHDRQRSAWSGQGGTTLTDVDVATHSDAVLRGLGHQLNKIDLEPGHHNVTLSSSAVADLMIYLLWTASAREAAQGRSVFSKAGGGTRIGEQLSKRNLTIATDPKLSGLETFDRVVNLGSSSMSSSFDTGLPIGRTEVIENGVLRALGSSRFAAKEAGLPVTALADNIEVVDAQGHGTIEQTAARMGDGLLITCLWYIREVDPQSLLLTGLTRDGVYVVRGGEVIGAANNFRFNDSPVSMLNRITDAGNAVNCLPREWADWFTRSRVAPLVIEGFNLSTRSDAI